MIQDFDFDIKHIPGNRIQHVDTLSRNIEPNLLTIDKTTGSSLFSFRPKHSNQFAKNSQKFTLFALCCLPDCDKELKKKTFLNFIKKYENIYFMIIKKEIVI